VDEVNKDTGEMIKKNIPFLKYYRVFNVLQCEGITYPGLSEETLLDPIAEAEALIEGYKERPEIKHGFVNACYNQIEDLIKMPNRSEGNGVRDHFITV